MGLATIIGFPTIGITLIGFIENDPWDFQFNWFYPLQFYYQILLGLTFGTLAGLFAWWFINRPAFLQIKMKYGIMINSLNLTLWDVLFLSFCAGVGEEFLFRGVLQPYWGIWITAIVFVAIHGYLDPRDKKMMAYGILMTVIIGAIGYMAIYFGLISSMMAHFAIDVVLLYKLSIDKAFAIKISQPNHEMRAFNPDETTDEKPEHPID